MMMVMMVLIVNWLTKFLQTMPLLKKVSISGHIFIFIHFAKYIDIGTYVYVRRILEKAVSISVNPLSANVGYIRHDTVVTSDSCNSGHSENYDEKI